MNLPRRAAALVVVAAVGAGCAVPAAETTPAASPSGVPASPTPSASATPSASPDAVDLTLPGAAEAMVEDLMDAAGAHRAIMVTLTQSEASVTVLNAGTPQTWAWRDERIQQVPSDIAYVDQRTFDPDAFDLSDLGALFRAAESVSGSRVGQALQIVDHSAGLVSMSVSTNPESRPVFFRADGTLLPTLDFSSAWGLAEGYADVVAGEDEASALGFGSAEGVYLDTEPDEDGAFERHQRTARTPVYVSPRNETTALASFDPALVDPAVVWAVLEGLRADGTFDDATVWTCVADDREDSGEPRLHFTVGETTFVTDLAGATIA